MSSVSGRTYCIVAFVLVAHAAYSMIQYRHFVTATQSQQSIPIDIIVECIAALALCVHGSQQMQRPLKPIKLSEQYNQRPWDGAVQPQGSEYINVRSRNIILHDIRQILSKNG